ncbi:glycosyltransferase family 2 protein [Gracilibacillus alcaliphilus]|uniref:glycosyltransferase family 2 protein n=1 Tax=Gracilibacillus alcaliphilus TaxID=1401441 RepID=UPI001956222B|nr:glycosyltransferase family 2 protein [Gracilibacillus alcaliphilus]MBM7679428.1 dolichol-phosphate mannosyltransferase [Gracilibacillus alcaliphilus]
MENCNKPLISVVVPVYGCKTCLVELCNRIKQTIQSIPADYEVILVNDASPDHAWEVILQLHQQDPQIKGIDLSRNFGQHHAITAGLDYCMGDWTVVMDCDLQDRPEEIANLYQKALEGYEVVFAQRQERQDRAMKKLSSKLFYKVFDYFSGQTSDASIANFSIISQEVVRSYRRLREQNRYFPFFVRWMGYSQAKIPVQHEARKEGKSSYPFRKLLSLATDAIVSQSNKPLRLSISVGFMMATLSFIYALYLFIRYFFLSQTVQGWTSTMVSLFFLGGLILFQFGIMGLYLGKIFNEVKNRPIYLVKDVTDGAEQKGDKESYE